VLHSGWGFVALLIQINGGPGTAIIISLVPVEAGCHEVA